ncbi:MAG TPA: hypothetical protein VGO39_14260 [Gaiellaceae bacterium]|nr:hypothetical protein [Gaiellaceae bacterium]
MALALCGSLALAFFAAASASGRESAVPRGVVPFDRASARVGQALSLGVGDVVTDRPIWSGGERLRVDIYLLPLARSPKWWPTYTGAGYAYGPPPQLRGAVRLGSVLRWEGEGQQLRVSVPSVPAGSYVLGYWCRQRNARWASALPNLRPTRSIVRIS